MRYAIVMVSLLLTLPALAETFEKGSVQYLDGKSKVGLIEQTMSDIILFKVSENAQVEKIESSLLRSVTYFGKEGNAIYFHLKTYLGWGQKRLSSEADWLRVVDQGVATLMVKNSSMRGSIYTTTSAQFADYYAFREGEEGAKLICQVSTFNNNQTFRAKAPLYFADYPALAEKIKSKQYTWKELRTSFKEYNAWVAAGKK
jgi:hypothetical protein